MSGLTHFDKNGNAVMVDVSCKNETARQAVAEGKISMSRECFEAARGGMASKGDVIGVARLAGIMAVKQTSALIPLCHNIFITKAHVDFEFDDRSNSISAICTVKTTGVTGVEMEALTGVTVALLTIYDMCKAMDKGMEISGILLVEKTGGKSGTYRRGS